MFKDDLEKEIKKAEHPLDRKSLVDRSPLFIARGIAEQNELINTQNKHLEGIEKALWAICKKSNDVEKLNEI